MNILTRYIFTLTLKSTLVSLLALILFDSLLKFINLSRFINHNYTIYNAIKQTLLLTPYAAYYYINIAVLIGTLIAVGKLVQQSQLIIIQSAGVTMQRIINTIISHGLLLACFALLLSETIIPITTQLSVQQRHNTTYNPNNTWSKKDNEFSYISKVSKEGLLTDFISYKFDNNKLISTTTATHGYYVDEKWLLKNINHKYFTPKKIIVENKTEQAWQSDLSVQNLFIFTTEKKYLSIYLLYKYLSSNNTENNNNKQYSTLLWTKILQPISIIATIMLAIFFVIGPLRNKTMVYKIMIGIITGISLHYMKLILDPITVIFSLQPIITILLPNLLIIAISYYYIKKRL